MTITSLEIKNKVIRASYSLNKKLILLFIDNLLQILARKLLEIERFQFKTFFKFTKVINQPLSSQFSQKDYFLCCIHDVHQLELFCLFFLLTTFLRV